MKKLVLENLEVTKDISLSLYIEGRKICYKVSGDDVNVRVIL